MDLKMQALAWLVIGQICVHRLMWIDFYAARHVIGCQFMR